MFSGKKVLPFIIIPMSGFLVFFILPFIGGLYYCFFDQLTGKFRAFDGFISIVKNEAFQLAMKNTLIVLVTFIPLIIITSVAAAYFICHMLSRQRYRKIGSALQNAVMLPYLMPSVALAYSFASVFEPGGFVSKALSYAGIESFNIQHSGYLIIAAGMIYIWKYSGINIVIIVSALLGIPKEVTDAAKVDGAGGITVLRKIILPLIYPELMFVLILSVMNSFKLFREIYIISGSYPPSNMYMLQHFINNNLLKFDYNKLVCAAYIFLLLISLPVIVLIRMEKKHEYN